MGRSGVIFIAEKSVILNVYIGTHGVGIVMLIGIVLFAEKQEKKNRQHFSNNN